MSVGSEGLNSVHRLSSFWKLVRIEGKCLMKKLFAMSVAWMFVALLAMPMAIAEEKEEAKEKAQRITLNVEGVECAGCAKVLTTTLAATDLKVVGRLSPTESGSSQVIAMCPANCDLAASAAKVNDAQTPHRDKAAPGLSLVLFAELDDDSQLTVQEALVDLQGIDAKACKYDTVTNQIRIKISGKDKVMVSQIVAALEDAGIESQLTQPRKQRDLNTDS